MSFFSIFFFLAGKRNFQKKLIRFDRENLMATNGRQEKLREALQKCLDLTARDVDMKDMEQWFGACIEDASHLAELRVEYIQRLRTSVEMEFEQLCREWQSNERLAHMDECVQVGKPEPAKEERKAEDDQQEENIDTNNDECRRHVARIHEIAHIKCANQADVINRRARIQAKLDERKRLLASLASLERSKNAVVEQLDREQRQHSELTERLQSIF
jgi:hypothetical protein